MQYVMSRGGSFIGQILPDRTYWAAKMNNGEWLTELDTMSDIAHAGTRPFDWTLDVVATGDYARITELWLFCPPTPTSPGGNTARLPITQAGTAFQFKVASMSGMGEMQRSLRAHVIGRVTDVETGDCECFIYDHDLQAMSEPWKSNVYHFGTWSEQVAPLGLLNLDVLGLRLPTRTMNG